MKRFFLFLSLFVYLFTLTAQPAKKKLRFAFLTDIHLNAANDGKGLEGLKQALDKTKELNVDFIITGGDHVDVSGMSSDAISKKDADFLYSTLKQTLDLSGLTYYPTIGNHDRYRDAANGFVNGDELFEKYFNESYYTFQEKGFHFFILNSVESGGETGYVVGEEQIKWIQNKLLEIDAETPIIIATHVPFYSLYYPLVENRYAFVDIISNYKELLKTFGNHNLQIVLQGHQHIHEEIKLQGVQFITGGAVSAGWWNGAFHGTEEGFMLVEIDEKNNFNWEYIDYGWNARK